MPRKAGTRVDYKKVVFYFEINKTEYFVVCSDFSSELNSVTVSMFEDVDSEQYLLQKRTYLRNEFGLNQKHAEAALRKYLGI